MKNLKQFSLPALAAFLAIVILFSCAKEQEVTGVKLDKSSIELTVGEKEVLNAAVVPTDAVNQSLSWQSSDEAVATVSADGTVTALSSGIATIIVKTKDGGFTATCKVSVSKKVISVSSVTVDPAELLMTEGDKYKLKVSVLPEDADNKKISWSSSNESVVAVSDSGELTAVAPGNATVKVVTEDGGKEASCKVTVSEKIIDVSSISLDNASISVYVGKSAVLNATVAPDDATSKALEWTSDNPAVATVDALGKVSGISEGVANITATSVQNPDVKAVCKVEVTVEIFPVTGIKLDCQQASVKVNRKLQLKAIIEPENASDRLVYWTSSDESVAKVNENGLVTALKVGSTVITAVSHDGGFTAKCAVTVEDNPVTSIVIQNASSDEIRIQRDYRIDLRATVEPSDAVDKSLVWSVDNEDIASIISGQGTENVRIQFNSVGRVVITASSSYTPTVKASQAYYVFSMPIDLTMTWSARDLSAGDSFQMEYFFSPYDATETGLVWTSSDPSVAVVNDNGLVTGVSPGTATITATSTYNESISDNCVFTILSINKVSINGAEQANFSTGHLEELLSAAGTVKTLAFESGMLDGDDVSALIRRRGDIVSMDLSNITLKPNTKYVHTTYYQPEQTSTIEAGVFPYYMCSYFSNLEYIKLPAVSRIDANAFYQCNKLKTVVMPDNDIECIGSQAFQYCTQLTSIDLSRVKTMESHAFYISGLSGTVDLSSLERFDSGAHFYQNDGISKIILGKNISSIGSASFGGCTSLTNVEIDPANPYLKFEDGLIKSKDGTVVYAAAGGVVTGSSYTLPSGVKTISDGAFERTDANAYVFPEGLESIGNYAFGFFYGTEITLPSTLKSMNYLAWAFSDLEKVTILAETPPAIDGGEAFHNCSDIIEIYVPVASVDAYKNAEGWSEHSSIIKPIE